MVALPFKIDRQGAVERGFPFEWIGPAVYEAGHQVKSSTVSRDK
jgi:hypothetical protein